MSEMMTVKWSVALAGIISETEKAVADANSIVTVSDMWRTLFSGVDIGQEIRNGTRWRNDGSKRG